MDYSNYMRLMAKAKDKEEKREYDIDSKYEEDIENIFQERNFHLFINVDNI